MKKKTFDNASELPWALHAPGDFLQEIAKINKLTQEDLAQRLGVSRRAVNEIINRKRGLSTEMAFRLAKLTGKTPEFWLNLQMQFDLAKARTDLPELNVRPIFGA